MFGSKLTIRNEFDKRPQGGYESVIYRNLK